MTKKVALIATGAFTLALIPLSWWGAVLIRKESQYWPNSHRQLIPWSGALRWVLMTYLLGAVAGVVVGSCAGTSQSQYWQPPLTPFNFAFWCTFAMTCFISLGILPKCI